MIRISILFRKKKPKKKPYRVLEVNLNMSIQQSLPGFKKNYDAL